MVYSHERTQVYWEYDGHIKRSVDFRIVYSIFWQIYLDINRDIPVTSLRLPGRILCYLGKRLVKGMLMA